MLRKISVWLICLMLFYMQLPPIHSEAAIVSMAGEGKKENPYIITTAEELNSVRNNLNAHYQLGNDIDISGYANWQPIGDGIHQFDGSFNGAGHVITGLKINDAGSREVLGLFGSIGYSGLIENIGLVDVIVNGNHGVGALAGFNHGMIKQSYSTGQVKGTAYVGGLVGDNSFNGVIENSYSTATVSGNNSIGGLVGQNDEFIQSSYASGHVSGVNFIGGLVGSNQGEETMNVATISNSYAAGDVAGQGWVGGLVGHNAEAQVINSYAIGKVTGSNNVGGLVGFRSWVAINASFYDKDTTGQTDTEKGTPKSTADMQKNSTFTNAGWDFNNTWGINPGGYPYLRAIPQIQYYHVGYDANGAMSGSVPVDGTNYKNGDHVIVHDNTGNLAKVGFQFVGWNTKADGSGIAYPPANMLEVGSENITLYAQWAIQNYKVEFKYFDDVKDDQFVRHNEKVNKPSDPQRTGYQFDGWYSDAEGTTPYDFDAKVISDLTLYAKWIINQYNVNFVSNGGSAVADVRVNYGDNVVSPKSPSKVGYTFAGWYSDSSLTTPYDFNKQVTSDVTLYAKWTINQYTVEFNSNGGEDVPNVKINHGNKVASPGTPSKDGYTFVNWYSDGLLTTLYDFNEPVTSNIKLYAKWNINKYLVVFNSNGGSTVASEIVNHNDKVIKPENPTKTGHIFDNWYIDTLFTNTYDFDLPIMDNTTLYAKWTIKQYTVRFESNGGNNVSDINVNFGDKATTPKAPSKLGHTFKGWYTNALLTELYDFQNNVASDMTLYAKWSINEYNISYESSGGSKVSSEKLNFEEKATKPADPTRTGYTFAGWYNDPLFKNLYDFQAKIVSDMTLYAKWTINEYNVSYESNGGSGISSEKVNYEEKATKPVDPTKKGYTFAGWYSDALFKNLYDFQTNIISDVKLYAKWTINEYNVSYESNGGSTASSEKVNYEEKATKPADPTRKGYTFSGWYSDELFTRPYDFQTKIVSDVTLYAKWTINEYKVSYESNGGSTVSSEKVNYDEKATKPANPTKTGYTFAGWYSDALFKNLYDFQTNIVSDVTLYAKWTINEYNISYESNGGSGVSSEKVNYEEKATKPADPTKAGHTFAGWHTDSNLTDLYDFNTPVQTAITLYAKWSVNDYRVEFDTNGGSIIPVENVKYKGKISEPKAPTKKGFTFAGWFSDKQLLQEFNFNEAVTKDMIVYAKWVSSNSKISSIKLSNNVKLSPSFNEGIYTYETNVDYDVEQLTLTFSLGDIASTTKVNGKKINNGENTITIPLSVGTNSIQLETTAPDGITKTTYSIQVTRAKKATSETEVVYVDVVSGNSDEVLVQTKIERTTEVDGTVKDSVSFNKDKAKEAMTKLKDKQDKTASIVIPDPENKVSEINVTVPNDTRKLLAEENAALQIMMEHAHILVPEESLADFDEEFYFRVVPVKTKEEQQIIESEARQEQLVKDILDHKDAQIEVLGHPMKIETNMQNHLVTLTLPLPTDDELTNEILDNLVIFIQHSDGTQEVVRGKLVEYKKGIRGIQFDVHKFSTFTVMYMEGADEYFSDPPKKDDQIEDNDKEKIEKYDPIKDKEEIVNPPKKDNPNKDNDSKDSGKTPNQEKKPLPNTATSILNWMFLGGFLILVGAVEMAIRRKKLN
ncbi:InlB B-repeat-containing protein [Bacillus sp. FJAT-49711]|uniref:InlB B-repeat-containing protein n=1 Tax=Bacillus sp. FJAT-49711 TaxID=2833585 RepID=UPI001BC9234C|nr:InlB B-repeat-containing protein [Bacillus sp. FJAT-49711]MBS4219173.1 InlB B-repeat-containing protein [Bacillus sp. FJAT-49711]